MYYKLVTYYKERLVRITSISLFYNLVKLPSFAARIVSGPHLLKRTKVIPTYPDSLDLWVTLISLPTSF